MRKLLCLLTILFSGVAYSQEKNKDNNSISKKSSFNAIVGVVDMKKILAQSKAYQSLVDQFEDVRRKQRNSFTKLEDKIRDEESELLKKKIFYQKKSMPKKLKN